MSALGPLNADRNKSEQPLNTPGTRWRDKHGDVWTMNGDWLTMSSPETASFTRPYIEHKWGPLTRLADAWSTHHIISNAEIGMTECGRMVDYHQVSDPTPWNVPTLNQAAYWDNEEPPSDSMTCQDCWKAYEA